MPVVGIAVAPRRSAGRSRKRTFVPSGSRQEKSAEITKHLNLGLDLDLLIAIGTSQQTLGAHDANGRWPSLRGKPAGGGKIHLLTDINIIYINNLRVVVQASGL